MVISYLVAATTAGRFAASRSLGVRACAETPPAALPTSLVSKTPLLGTLEGTAGLVQVNHYAILGVPVGAPNAQIADAFKKRCEELMQQKELTQEGTQNQLRSLQTSFDILTSEEERRVYDWALQRYENREGAYIWPYETDITQRYTSKEPVPVFQRDAPSTQRLMACGRTILAIAVHHGSAPGEYMPDSTLQLNFHESLQKTR